MAGKCLEEFEKLNTTTESIHELKDCKVLIILKDGTNLTSWYDVDDRNDVVYVSEDLSDYRNLSEKYRNMESLKAIVASGVSGRVRNMRAMFEGCISLMEISGLEDWDVSNVRNMKSMFHRCFALSDLSPLKGWDVSNVKDMSFMFGSSGMECMIFGDVEYCLDDLSPLAGWDVSSVAAMRGMFGGCCRLKDLFALSGWDVSAARDMLDMFRCCFFLEDVSGLAGWDVSNVKTMYAMFSGCNRLSDLSALAGWDVSAADRKSVV